MSVVRLDQYLSNGRIKLGDAGWSLYAAFTEPEPGHSLVKVGVSTVPLKRIHAVHCGSPYPIKVALWTHVGWKSEAMKAEHEIKKAFRDHKSRGEWFDFDLTSPEQKEFFHRTFRVAFMRATGKSIAWQKVTLEQIRSGLGIPDFSLRG